LTLPESISAAQLYLSAIDHGVAFAVGSVFYPQHPALSSLRLNFAAHSPAQIDEGLRRLGRAVREHLSRSSVLSGVQMCSTQAR
jgi:DNA-binding transcriptional MocR family regulator